MVHGYFHTIDFISYDDGYSPPKTVEQVRRLVEEDQVDFCFQNLGTPCNSAIAEFLTSAHLLAPEPTNRCGIFL
jgi:hypothetical protein